MNIHAILCCLVKSLNYVVYEHVLIERVTEEVERMLTAVNVNRVFTQFLTLVLLHFIEAARTPLLNNVFIVLLALLFCLCQLHFHLSLHHYSEQ